MQLKEIWKDIEGFKDLYMVSNFGNVKSLDRIILHMGRWGKMNKKPISGKKIISNPNRDGYLKVSLGNGVKAKTFPVHRLVAVAFIPNLQNKRTINHKDGNKLNNNDCNLEWNTYSENMTHAFRTGLKKQKSGQENKRSIPISQFTKEGVWVKDWSCAREVGRSGAMGQGNIHRALKGKLKSAYGFIWKLKATI